MYPLTIDGLTLGKIAVVLTGKETVSIAPHDPFDVTTSRSVTEIAEGDGWQLLTLHLH